MNLCESISRRHWECESGLARSYTDNSTEKCSLMFCVFLLYYFTFTVFFHLLHLCTFSHCQGRVMQSMMSVCLSVCHSVCERDNSWMHLRMSTKHGRHGQGVTVWKWLHFGVDLNPGGDLRSLFYLLCLNIMWYGLIQYILTHQRAPPHLFATVQWPWQSLRSLNTSGSIVDGCCLIMLMCRTILFDDVV